MLCFRRTRRSERFALTRAITGTSLLDVVNSLVRSARSLVVLLWAFHEPHQRVTELLSKDQKLTSMVLWVGLTKLCLTWYANGTYGIYCCD